MDHNRNQTRDSRPSNQYFETYVNTMRSNNILLNRIMDQIQVTERTMRSQLEHSRSMDQQLFNIISAPRERSRNTFTRRTPFSVPTQTFNWDSLSLSPVPVRPNQAQIRRATTNLLFREISNPSNLLCPITQQPFESNDSVTMIDHCRHIFSRNELAEWFGSNVRCPVCRYDIREHPIEIPTNLDAPATPNTANENEEDDTDAATERHILNNLAESINSEIERLSGNETSNNDGISERQFLMDPSGNLTYRFTLRSRSADNLRDD